MYTIAQLERIQHRLRVQKAQETLGNIILYIFCTAWIVALAGLVYVVIKAKLLNIT